jgi:hypothetical protein
LCSARLSHKVTVLTAAGVLCLAASGTVAVTWAAPSATPAQAADMLSPHPVTRAWPAGTAQQAPQDNLARQAVLIRVVDRAAAAHAAAVARAAARRAAAARAAARAIARAAAERAAAWHAARQAAAEQAATAAAVRPLYSGTPRHVAGQLLVQYGWAGQFSCLDALWGQESGWSVYAENPSSGAYGIPQALPASKMASAGPDWRSDAATQINWGLGYIKALYGSPCTAWDHEEAVGWY